MSDDKTLKNARSVAEMQSMNRIYALKKRKRVSLSGL